jgi:hypothetical protein
MMDALATLNDPHMVLAPAWAQITQEAGYNRSASTIDPTTSVYTTTLSDAIHPVGGNRAALFRALAAYVACAFSGLL